MPLADIIPVPDKDDLTSIVVADGIVYVADLNGNLYAFQA
jgi:outer membrane protein assembly factor BamB